MPATDQFEQAVVGEREFLPQALQVGQRFGRIAADDFVAGAQALWQLRLQGAEVDARGVLPQFSQRQSLLAVWPPL